MTFDFNKQNSLDLFMRPTPIRRLEELSKRFKKNISVKRDDKTGFVFSGNKIRKLSYLLKDALDLDCNFIVTCGGIQSNHARATAYAARELGLGSCLLLRGEPLEIYKGNYLLNKLVGADIEYISYEDWEHNYSRMEELASIYKSKGLRPYIIPEGGSNCVGALGYVNCFHEILKQSAEAKQYYSDIVSATGSGGTTAGLLLGSAITNQQKKTKIHTINVCDDETYFQKRITGIVHEFKSHYDCQDLEIQELSIHGGYVGPGYAETTPAQLKKIQDFCTASGLLLDPVYTGKAFFGLLEELHKNPENFGDDILFIHTGGGFANFSFEQGFSTII
jgi:D-cysteine desulfhydrase